MSAFTDLPPVFQTDKFSPGSHPPKIYVLDHNPTTTVGYLQYEAVLNKVSGDVLQLLPVNGVFGWQTVANVRGPIGASGDGNLDPEDLAVVIGDVQELLEPPIDLTVLFNNAMTP